MTISRLLTLIALAAVLTACGGGGGEGSSQSSPPVTMPPPADDPPADDPPADDPPGDDEPDPLAADHHREQIGANETIPAGKTGAGATVVIIDGGMFAGHNTFDPTRQMAGFDATGNGRDPYTEFVNGHGTHMADLAVGEMSGIAPDALYAMFKNHHSSDGIAFQADNASAFNRVALGDWDVALMSFGSSTTNDGGLGNAIEAATTADTAVVLSAGNSPPSTQGYAHEADDPRFGGALVAAICLNENSDGLCTSNHATATGFEGNVVQAAIMAPGRLLTHAAHDKGPDGIAASTGSSDSAAVVAGALAVIRSEFPTLTAAQAVQAILESADPVCQPSICGAGALNLPAALERAELILGS